MQNLKKLLADACDKKYAVVQFNIHTLTNMRAAVRAALECNAPVIIACTKASFDFSGMKIMIACFKELEQQAKIPMVLHIDHYTNYNDIKHAIDLGIKSVMIDASKLRLTENIALTRRVVDYAHPRGVTVEAEIGEVGGVEDGVVTSQQSSKNESLTSPETIKRFVMETNVDLLAIGIGNVHGKYHVKPVIKSEILTKASELVNIPFVLHGASGLSDKQITECINAGCRKINIGTELKTPFVAELKS